MLDGVSDLIGLPIDLFMSWRILVVLLVAIGLIVVVFMYLPRTPAIVVSIVIGLLIGVRWERAAA